MSSTQQRSELQSQIWKIANDVRGSVDGWDFKQFVLGTLFYRGGAEQKIRQYLIDNNFVETVISLVPNLFFGRTIVGKIDRLRSDIDAIVAEIDR